MRRKLSDSAVVITGASSGIGLATALFLAREGAAVVLAARSEEALEAATAECEAAGGLTLPVPTDVADERQVQNLARRAVETYGRIDAWINNAGVGVYSRFEEIPADVFRRVIETNFFGCVYGARAVLPYFREQGHGVLINVSSGLGKIGAPFNTAYAASKFAVNGFSESLRMELRDTPEVRVCTIIPGSTDTPFFWHAGNFTGRAVKPMEPMLRAEQVAEAIARCIVHPRREVYVGSLSHATAAARMLPHAITETVTAAKVSRDHFEPLAEAPGVGNVFAPVGPYNQVSGHWHDLLGKPHHRRAKAAALLLGIAAIAAILHRQRTR